MQQINNGLAEYYYIEEDGQVYNSKDNSIVKTDKKHILKLRDKENKRISISLKTLYKKVYGKPFCKD